MKHETGTEAKQVDGVTDARRANLENALGLGKFPFAEEDFEAAKAVIMSAATGVMQSLRSAGEGAELSAGTKILVEDFHNEMLEHYRNLNNVQRTIYSCDDEAS